jgi:hypothetical protein
MNEMIKSRWSESTELPLLAAHRTTERRCRQEGTMSCGPEDLYCKFPVVEGGGGGERMKDRPACLDFSRRQNRISSQLMKRALSQNAACQDQKQPVHIK